MTGESGRRKCSSYPKKVVLFRHTAANVFLLQQRKIMKSIAVKMSTVKHVTLGRGIQSVRLVAVIMAIGLATMEPATAQSLKAAAVSVFNYIYTVVGVIGAIAVLVTALNWATGNWMGREEPKKLFFQALLGTGVAFGVVALIQFIKDSVGISGSGVDNL